MLFTRTRQMVFWLLLSCFACFAEARIVIEALPVNLTDFRIDYYIDDSQNLDYPEVRGKTFSETASSTSLGTNARVAWYRLSLENRASQTLDLNLHLPHAYHVQSIRFYEERDGTLALNVLGYGADADLAVLGIGLGALGELPGLVLQNETRLSAWHQQVESGVLSASSAVRSDEGEVLQRKVMRSLMCRQSITLDSLTETQREKWIVPLSDQGYAEEEAGIYRLTELGLTMLPHVWTDSSPAFRAF